MPKLGYKHPIERKRKLPCPYCKHDGLKKSTFVAMGYAAHLRHVHLAVWQHGKLHYGDLSPLKWPEFSVTKNSEGDIIGCVGIKPKEEEEEEGEKELMHSAPFNLPPFGGRMILRDATGVALDPDLYPQWVKAYNAQGAEMGVDMTKDQTLKIVATWNEAEKGNQINVIDPPPDLVNHPPHYTFGKYEVIDVLSDWFPHDPMKWNAVKYIARASHKHALTEDEIQDLEKAIFYLKRKIAMLKGEIGDERRSPRDDF